MTPLHHGYVTIGYEKFFSNVELMIEYIKKSGAIPEGTLERIIQSGGQL